MSKLWLTIMLAWGVVLANTVTAFGADMGLPATPGDMAISQRLASLEAEVQRLRATSPVSLTSNGTLADPSACGTNGCAYGPTVGRECSNCECRTGGFVGGVEVVFFKPFYTGGGIPNVDAAASDPFTGFINYQQLQYNYQAAPRFWLGYVFANGLGGRARFFDYHQTAASDVSNVFTAPPGIFTLHGLLALRTYDLELTQQVNFRNWSLQAFGGVRYAQVRQQSSVDIFGLTTSNSSLAYYGVGLTGGLQGERVLTPNQRWSIFFSGRGSLLFGHQRDNTSDLFFLYTEGNRRIDNAFASIWEMQLGPQWKMRLPRGGEFFARTTVEGQFWQGVGNFAPIGTSPAPGLNHNDLSGSFGLLGFGSAIGITR
jgi:hypothetical protein